MEHPTSPERHVSRGDIAPVVLGWATFVALRLVAGHLGAPVPAGTLAATLALIVGVIVVCAFGVVGQAEALARRLGDPYGSLVLTLSIVLIEVVLIAAVMIGPGVHPTIGRDSVMAVSMIILNLVIGLSIVFAGRRHGHLVVDRRGTVAYLVMITLLSAIGFAVPQWIGDRGGYSTSQAPPVIVGVVALYGFFLYRQMGPRADDFREIDIRRVDADAHAHVVDLVATASVPVGRIIADHRGEIITRLAVLVVTMIPIVLLSHDMATLLDDGLGRAGAPVALTGVLIAGVVFLPEGLTSVRAALGGEMQRVSNLCHGALVSTLALTIPSVLAVGLITGETVVLAESSVNLTLLAVTVLVSWSTFTARRITTAHGIVHLGLFVVYGVTVLV